MNNTGRKIFFLVSHSSAGGAQEIWTNLAEAFRERGHDVALLALYPLREDVRETSPHLFWRYVVPDRPREVRGVLRLARRLVGIIRNERPEMILTAMPAANVLAAVAARLAGARTRVIISHHTPAGTYNPLLQRADRYAGSLSSVKAIVTVSDAVAASLDDRPVTYRRKLRTIRNALPPDVEALIAELARGRAGHVPATRTVVATGRLAAQKNYPMLLRAMSHMPDVRLQIVGGGPDEAMLKDLAVQLGVQDRVHFLGHKAREEAVRLLATGDVFVQVSLFEGHSLALVEAAKLALPIVVSDVPVQIEGITAADGMRCGISVPAGEDAQLAREVLKLLDDPGHYTLWSRLAAKLGSEATYPAMISAYERLADEAFV